MSKITVSSKTKRYRHIELQGVTVSPKRTQKKSDSSMIVNDARKSVSEGQAKKSARGMPWHWEPMKDVAIYEKPREAESRH